jgi:hypothetical protein
MTLFWFSFGEYLSSSVENFAFLYSHPHDTQRIACNEESCLINPVCSGTACRCSHIRGEAAEECLPRISYLSPSDAATESTRSEPFRLAMRELGYIEGQNIAIDYRYGEGKQDRVPEIAAELVRLKVDIIVARGGARRSGRPRMRPRRFRSL